MLWHDSDVISVRDTRSGASERQVASDTMNNG